MILSDKWKSIRSINPFNARLSHGALGENNSEIINMSIFHSKYDIAMQTPIPKPVIYVLIHTTPKPYA